MWLGASNAENITCCSIVEIISPPEHIKSILSKSEFKGILDLIGKKGLLDDKNMNTRFDVYDDTILSSDEVNELEKMYCYLVWFPQFEKELYTPKCMVSFTEKTAEDVIMPKLIEYLNGVGV